MNRYLPLVVSSYVVALAFAFSDAALAQDDIAVTFTYHGPAAKSVEVAGEFNNWKMVPMTKDATGNWTKTVYLKPGFYGYKFIVDGEWIYDPTNPERKRVDDVENSAISVGGVKAAAAPVTAAVGMVPVSFSYFNPAARTVHVAGEFNGWLIASEAVIIQKPEWAMQNDGAGNWRLTTQLRPGQYKFKYVIDGGGLGANWVQDPKLPSSDDGNSIIDARAGAVQQVPTSVPQPTPVLPLQGAVSTRFSYADPSAKSVALVGEFNQWNQSQNPMNKDEYGIWTVTVPLKPGRYQYKFVVDGVWKEDPASLESADDGFGGKNSIRIVTQ